MRDNERLCLLTPRVKRKTTKNEKACVKVQRSEVKQSGDVEHTISVLVRAVHNPQGFCKIIVKL